MPRPPDQSSYQGGRRHRRLSAVSDDLRAHSKPTHAYALAAHLGYAHRLDLRARTAEA